MRKQRCVHGWPNSTAPLPPGGLGHHMRELSWTSVAPFRTDDSHFRRMILDQIGQLISSPVWVDFMRTDWDGRVRLDLPGTFRALERSNISLVEGMRILLYTEDANSQGKLDDLVAIGTLRFDPEESRWAALEIRDLCHVSNLDAHEAELFRAARAKA